MSIKKFNLGDALAGESVKDYRSFVAKGGILSLPRNQLEIKNNFYKKSKPIEIVVEEAPPPEPTFSKEQLDAAMKEGVEQGIEQGIALGKKEAMEEYQASLAKEQLEILAYIKDNIQQTLDSSEEVISKQDHEARVLTSAIVTHLLEATARKNAQKEIISVVETILQRMRKIKTLRVEVSLDCEDALRESLKELVEGYGRNIQLQVVGSDKIVHPQDTKVSWEDGELIRDWSKAYEEVCKIVSDMDAEGIIENYGYHDKTADNEKNDDASLQHVNESHNIEEISHQSEHSDASVNHTKSTLADEEQENEQDVAEEFKDASIKDNDLD